MARILAIANPKCGTGKTTTTMNLGIWLARSGKKVLLVDTDPLACLTISLGFQSPDSLKNTLVTLMQSTIRGSPPLSPYEHIYHHKGIDLLPANINLSGEELCLFSVKNRERILKDCIADLCSDYDFILIDCPPVPGMMNTNALVAADSVIIPTEFKYLMSKSLDPLLYFIDNIRRSINPSLQVEGILLTMPKSGTHNAKTNTALLNTSLNNHVRIFTTRIPYSISPIDATQEDKMMPTYYKSSIVSDAYEAFAQEVMDLDQRNKYRSRSDGVR